MSSRLELIKEFNDAIFNNDIIKNKNMLIFIYTPPKVGSTTLVTSLRMCCANVANVLHIHDEHMLTVVTGVKNIHNISVIELIKFNAFIGKQVYVIDVYRNQIERKISEYFELLSCYHFNATETNIVNYNLDLLSKRFNSLFPYLGSGDYFFDKYCISIPDNFDFDKKYLCIKEDDVNYIKLRLCDSRDWGNILTTILNMDIVIVKDYQTESKPIGSLYKKFNEQYQIPFNLLESIQTCKYFNYYNTDNEKEQYMSLWKTKTMTTYFEPYSREKYDFYKEISSENQFYNVIQRDHYLDHGCICNSCSQKRNRIIMKIKKGEKTDTRIIHEEVVQERKNQIVEKLNNNLQNRIMSVSKHKNVINMMETTSYKTTKKIASFGII
jgi:hypothetical protein